MSFSVYLAALATPWRVCLSARNYWLSTACCCRMLQTFRFSRRLGASRKDNPWRWAQVDVARGNQDRFFAGM